MWITSVVLLPHITSAGLTEVARDTYRGKYIGHECLYDIGPSQAPGNHTMSVNVIIKMYRNTSFSLK